MPVVRGPYHIWCNKRMEIMGELKWACYGAVHCCNLSPSPHRLNKYTKGGISPGQVYRCVVQLITIGTDENSVAVVVIIVVVGGGA